MFGNQAIKFHMDAITLPFNWDIQTSSCVHTRGIVLSVFVVSTNCHWGGGGGGGGGENVSNPAYHYEMSCL